MLELIHVTKYYKKKLAVDDVSFKVGAGEVFGLIGANGAGKSTIVSMVATLEKPDSGQIMFNGVDIVKHPGAIREKLGFVPQDIALYESLTGYDNLSFWGKSYHVRKELLEERINKVCRIIGFDDELLRIKVKNYSGGMKRRLNIGVALLHEPELVIMDEPTVGIDMQSRAQIFSSIQELSRTGTAVIYVGHYMEEIERICSSVCMIESGKCVLNDNMEHILEGDDTLENLYLSKLGSR